ncbi:insecticidal toxin complex protein [Enhygromyxa salina]|uniref:Insecticidal toxin complex protein n=1 Tax=Enhygromyxa salina TaxID=215803 RepID=A0A0C2D177_9BACT|nr:insecticidal toxin complex protein [Enhygromyxa salina]
MVHAPASGTGWTRRYQYRTDGNRLVGTSAPADSAGALYTNTATYSHTYPHDIHGNFTAMPHMAAMEWDELDQLQHCTVGSQDVYFQYAGGQRVRKYVEHAGATTEERIYLGSFELYRKRVNGTLKEEWESLHVSDDTGRIVLVETHTVDDGNAVGSPTGIWRFQLSNHLGSAATEVTETGAVISYEEYHPYGTSAYRLVDSQIDVPAKRYRYTGMERDEETGLGYHTARYYAPWLGRWTATDPIGLAGGINRFIYTANPTGRVDTTGLSEGISGKDSRSAGGYVPYELTIPEYLPGDAGGEVSFSNDETGTVVGNPLPSSNPQARADQRQAQAQYERDLEQAQNIQPPLGLYEMFPAHAEPFLNDQTVGIQDPFLDLHADFVQSSQRKVTYFGGRVQLVGNLALEAMGLHVEVLSLRAALLARRGLLPTSSSAHRTLGAITVVESGTSDIGTGLRSLAVNERTGQELFLLEGGVGLPGGRTIVETGLADCHACVESTIAVHRTLSGNPSTALEIIQDAPAAEAHGTRVLKDISSTSLAPTTDAYAPNLVSAADALSSRPGSVGVAQFEMLEPDGSIATEGHILNFLTDSAGNVVFIDALATWQS